MQSFDGYRDTDRTQQSYRHVQVAGDTLSDTWQQNSGSIDSGFHPSFYPDGQRYGSDSNQTLVAIPQECPAPSLLFPRQKWKRLGKSHILLYVST